MANHALPISISGPNSDVPTSHSDVELLGKAIPLCGKLLPSFATHEEALDWAETTNFKLVLRVSKDVEVFLPHAITICGVSISEIPIPDEKKKTLWMAGSLNQIQKAIEWLKSKAAPPPLPISPPAKSTLPNPLRPITGVMPSFSTVEEAQFWASRAMFRQSLRIPSKNFESIARFVAAVRLETGAAIKIDRQPSKISINLEGKLRQIAEAKKWLGNLSDGYETVPDIKKSPTLHEWLGELGMKSNDSEGIDFDALKLRLLAEEDQLVVTNDDELKGAIYLIKFRYFSKELVFFDQILFLRASNMIFGGLNTVSLTLLE